MSRGVFITFEGTEGCGKSTQIQRLAERLRARQLQVLTVREPGGTPIGEEIRHTLQHSHQNHAMTPETELLLMNASRAQLVRETIRPALERGEVVLCDRFYHSTLAYQGYGRGLDLALVRSIIDLAVGPTRPDRTLLLRIPLSVSLQRRRGRAEEEGGAPARDRMEEADSAFFQRVEQGYDALAREEPQRLVTLDATPGPGEVEKAVWGAVVDLVEGIQGQK